MKPCVHRGELLTRGCGCKGQRVPEDMIYRCWQGGAVGQCVPTISVLSPDVLTSAGYKLCDTCDLRQEPIASAVSQESLTDRPSGGVDHEYVRQYFARQRSMPTVNWEGKTNVFVPPCPMPPLPVVTELKQSAVTPLAIYRIDTANCMASLQHFNPGAIHYRGERLVAYRHNWSGSRIRLARIDGDYVARDDRQVQTAITSYNSSADEDPRMFVYKGQPCISFNGTSRIAGKLAVSMIYVVLNPTDYSVSAQYVVDYPERRYWEKNWTFFDHDGELLAVYDIFPGHRIIRVDGYQASTLVDTDCPAGLVDSCGLPRGGAPPMRVGDEYWCFYHGVVSFQGKKRYGMGLYCFEAKSPFKITRFAPGPLLWPDEADRWCDGHVSVVFPGGAMLRGRTWEVVYGYQDRWMEVALFDHKALEEALVPA